MTDRENVYPESEAIPGTNVNIGEVEGGDHTWGTPAIFVRTGECRYPETYAECLRHGDRVHVLEDKIVSCKVYHDTEKRHPSIPLLECVDCPAVHNR